MPKKKQTILVSDHESVKKTLYDEILRKDKIIDKLKKENELLLKTALKRSNELEEIREKTTKFVDYKTSSKTAKKRKS